jgi:hypothetical protein
MAFTAHLPVVSTAAPDVQAIIGDLSRVPAGPDVASPPDVSRLLASRLMSALDDRPFRPTTAQLAWVWGGDLVPGEARASRARIASARYASLFAEHVVRDMTIEGAPGAYARIWLCARLAFVSTLPSEAQPSAGGEVLAWENEGGAASAVRSSARRPGTNAVERPG